MENAAHHHYRLVAEAIDYIRKHFKEQPGLEEIAAYMHLSPFHFQKTFTEWAGISPKKFLQYISIEYAKNMLKEQQATLFDTAMETGLSGTSRLHDLFITIEGMTPGEFRNGGENLSIRHSFAQSPFGDLIIASTEKGICHMAFTDDPAEGFIKLKTCFPGARHVESTEPIHLKALHVFQKKAIKPEPLNLHLRGTPFQLKVWDTLLKIPSGQLSTYGRIAEDIQQPSASRAVGTAIGSNPVAYLIPCHRVIQSGGISGGYMWGAGRKIAMIGWEAAQKGDKE